jgi:hypothetical protein
MDIGDGAGIKKELMQRRKFDFEHVADLVFESGCGMIAIHSLPSKPFGLA